MVVIILGVVVVALLTYIFFILFYDPKVYRYKGGGWYAQGYAKGAEGKAAPYEHEDDPHYLDQYLERMRKRHAGAPRRHRTS